MKDALAMIALKKNDTTRKREHTIDHFLEEFSEKAIPS